MKTTTQKIGFIATAIVLGMSLFLTACKKEAGPTGPAGKDGNANVVLYKFPGNNFATTTSIENYVTMPQDSFDGYAWFAYLKYNSSNTYAMPGYGYGGSTDYRFYTFNNSATDHGFVVAKVTGPGEAYIESRIVGIQIGKVIGKKYDLPEINFNDYNAVKKYYKLKD